MPRRTKVTTLPKHLKEIRQKRNKPDTRKDTGISENIRNSQGRQERMARTLKENRRINLGVQKSIKDKYCTWETLNFSTSENSITDTLGKSSQKKGASFRTLSKSFFFKFFIPVSFLVSSLFLFSWFFFRCFGCVVTLVFLGMFW